MAPYIITISVFLALLIVWAIIEIREKWKRGRLSYWFGSAWKKYD